MTLGSYKRSNYNNNRIYTNLIRTTSLTALVQYFRLLLMKFVVGFLCPKHWLNLPHPSLCSPQVSPLIFPFHIDFFYSLTLSLSLSFFTMCFSLCIFYTKDISPLWLAMHLHRSSYFRPDYVDCMLFFFCIVLFHSLYTPLAIRCKHNGQKHHDFFIIFHFSQPFWHL